MNITWNAEHYASNFDFVPRYGKSVMELITAPQGSRVLDLGCGNGTLTAELAKAGFKVTGMDASPELIAMARKQHPDLYFEKGDATDFEVPEKMDVVFSNAVFHWIDREQQPALLGCIARALKASGELIFEMGGKGNNALIHRALAEEFNRIGRDYQMPFYFPSIGEYAALIEEQGLEVRTALLFDRPTPLQGEEGLKDWIEMFVTEPFAGMDPDLKEQLLKRSVERLRPYLFKDGTWYADYMRLRMRAVKS